jgi:hypothetical protein
MDPIGIVLPLRAMRTVRPLSVAVKLRLAAPGVSMTCPFVPRRMVNSRSTRWPARRIEIGHGNTDRPCSAGRA